MSPLLTQFIAEARELLQGIGEKLLALESAPGNSDLMSELFRLVHTLKGNSGLFDFPEMTRVLHAGEDLMDAVRDSRVGYSQVLADELLNAMDFVELLLDEIEKNDSIGSHHASASHQLSSDLRKLISTSQDETGSPQEKGINDVLESNKQNSNTIDPEFLALIDGHIRDQIANMDLNQQPLLWIKYTPEAECFFKGEDPFNLMRNCPQLMWGATRVREPWPELQFYDCYRCQLVFYILTSASHAEIEEHFRYIPEQIYISVIDSLSLEEQSTPTTSITNQTYWNDIVKAQLNILSIQSDEPWTKGRLQSVVNTLLACFHKDQQKISEITSLTEKLLGENSTEDMIDWLTKVLASTEASQLKTSSAIELPNQEAEGYGSERKYAQRAEDNQLGKVLKVDQIKIDRLMDLIGEMVVAKNSLPYLANKAENQFGVRELARDIKTQYAVINRISEEMQDAIMQVRLMAVSFIFQRFPRLVRDISRKLEKEVELILEGEDTEADKNIIESLADPLIHIVRNSLDHGLENPAQRKAQGKNSVGKLLIRASQESDRVVIEIIDDGRGIDPVVIKQKAYEKGLIDESLLQRITDQEAINLVFMPGFSTADVISDLSGRGVGMDVVRNAITKVGGTVSLTSELGKGTQLRLSLPLSMAVTNVIIIESDKQIFGIPMDAVVETIRVPHSNIRSIKHQKTIVLRDRVIPVFSLNNLLAIAADPIANDENEFAILVVRLGSENVGIIVDRFREVIDVILKPLPGELANIGCYGGTALLGDGSVLMVINPKELF